MQRIYTLLLIYTSAQKGITTAVASCWPWEYKRPEQRDRRNGRTSFVAICLMYRHMRRERGFWVIIMRTGDFRMLVPICWIWTFCRSTFLSLSLSLSLTLTHTRRKRQKCSRQRAEMIGDDLPLRYVLRRNQCKNMRKWVTTGRIPHGDARLGEFSFDFQMHRFFVLISFLIFRFTSWRKTTPKKYSSNNKKKRQQQQ